MTSVKILQQELNFLEDVIVYMVENVIVIRD